MIWYVLYAVGMLWCISILIPFVLKDIGMKYDGAYEMGDIIFSVFISIIISPVWPAILVGVLAVKSGLADDIRKSVTRFVDGR